MKTLSNTIQKTLPTQTNEHISIKLLLFLFVDPHWTFCKSPSMHPGRAKVNGFSLWYTITSACNIRSFWTRLHSIGSMWFDLTRCARVGFPLDNRELIVSPFLPLSEDPGEKRRVQTNYALSHMNKELCSHANSVMAASDRPVLKPPPMSKRHAKWKTNTVASCRVETCRDMLMSW